MSARSARGSTLTGPSPLATTLVGSSCRMFENDHRVCGKRNQLPSAKRISLSGGGGAPTIHPMVTGSLACASNACGMVVATVARADCTPQVDTTAFPAHTPDVHGHQPGAGTTLD